MTNSQRDRVFLFHGSFFKNALMVLVIVATVAITNCARAADCTTTALTALSTCPKDAQGDVTIGSASCKNAYLDQSLTGAKGFRRINVQANSALCVRDADFNGQPMSLEAGAITVEGLFEAGRTGAEIGKSDGNNHLTIIFNDSIPANLNGPPTMMPPCPDPHFDKGIEVCAKGSLRLFGYEGAPVAGSARHDMAHVSWTFLKHSAGDPNLFSAANGVADPVTAADAKTLDVADAVDWKTGDWIVVATTSFSPFESEFVQLASDPQPDGSGGSILTLANSLAFYHFGGADPGVPSPANFAATKATNWGVDERAEVGLISRNIKLTASIDPNKPKEIHRGGEIIIRENFAEASIQGVELEKFGKDQLGSYPIHFHMDGVLDSNQIALINADSIHHSFNKCVTVHETAGTPSRNLVIQNLVCARAIGHLFYEETGNEENVAFQYNLGLGAMSNSFNIDGWDSNPAQRAAERTQLIDNYWWVGDNLASTIGYDGFMVPNRDNHKAPTHGSCFEPDPNLPGSIVLKNAPPCEPHQIYFEPASGFWLTNPATRLIGNSIGGCQGDGKGYWYVPPGAALPRLKSKQSDPKQDYWAKLQSVSFSDNRVHGCESGVYGEGEFGIVSDQLLPTVGGQLAKVSVVTTFDGITATRNRNRGTWLRPNWFSIKNARFAMNRDNAALVTAGGFDGASPGDWGLVSGSTFVGISLNNVDRFGPCPYPGVAGPGTKYNTGGRFGCIDNNSAANDIINQGYPPPEWNMAGYYTYDGPARIFNDRFVNFIANTTFPIAPYFTAQDQTYLDWYISSGRMGQHANKYEGDAAIGWFNSNQSSYPVSTTFDQLKFENVDLRHQVFTDLVNFAKFNDGDKNTAIVDRDGSLTGFSIVGGGMTQPDDIFPVSLNDLPFNAASNAVTECHSTGAQNIALEGRPSSLISPGDIGSLELQAQWPYPTRKNPKDPAFHFQWIKFADDATFNKDHQTEYLYGRNGLGIWEPKITSGYGYTISISAAPPPGADPNDPQPKQAPGDPPAVAGIPHIVDIGLTDARVARVPGTHTPKPFFVRLGICYGTAANSNGAMLKDTDFEVERGYRSWGGGLGGSTLTDTELNKYWNVNKCHNLDEQINKEPNKDYIQACPSGALVPPNPSTGLCDPDGVLTDGMCKYAKKPLQPVDCSALAGASPTADKYCYNKDTGWLYFYLAQKTFNAEGPSPVGDCTTSNHVSSCMTSCPAGQYQSPADCTCSTFNPCPNPDQTKDGFGFGETYYSCPNEGCGEYRVRVKPSANYEPGPSTCADPYQNAIVPAPQPTPAAENMLAVGSTPVVQTIKIGTDNIPYADPVPTPDCSAGQPVGSNPPWSDVVITPNLASFQINNNGAKPAMVNIVNQVVYPVIQDIQFVAADLAIGGTYTLNATRAGTPCQSSFTTLGTAVSPQYTASSMNNGCNIVPLSGGAIITLQ